MDVVGAGYYYSSMPCFTLTWKKLSNLFVASLITTYSGCPHCFLVHNSLRTATGCLVFNIFKALLYAGSKTQNYWHSVFGVSDHPLIHKWPPNSNDPLILGSQNDPLILILWKIRTNNGLLFYIKTNKISLMIFRAQILKI